MHRESQRKGFNAEAQRSRGERREKKGEEYLVNLSLSLSLCELCATSAPLR